MKIFSSVITALTLLVPTAIVGATTNFVVNNECTNAIKITDGILPFFDSKNGSLASFNPRDPTASCVYSTNEGNTMWYQYYSESDGILIADITNSEQLPIMTLYSGTSCRSLRELVCIVDETVIYYPVYRGQTYYIKTGDAELEFYGPGVRNLTVAKDRNYFYVIDDVTNQKYSLLYDLFNGGYNSDPVNTIDYWQLTNPSLSIGANFTSTSAPVRSVFLTVDNQPVRHTICENRAPYTLFGDDGPNVFGSKFTLGNRVVTATAYASPNCNGTVVGRLRQSFLVRGCRQVHFSLYDARTDKYIKAISNATVITNPPCEMSIGLTFECGFEAKNIQFILRRGSDNSIVSLRNETTPPYFMFGDDGRGGIHPGSIPPGNYILSASIDGIIHKPVNFTISGQCRSRPIADTTFDIDLRFQGAENAVQFGFTYEQAQLFQPVLRRLTNMIIGDKPQVNTTGLPAPSFCGEFPPLIDDLYICTGLFNYSFDNDELLGFLLNSYARESDGLPFASTILIDVGNFQRLFSRGLAANYVLQQLIQTLGLGLQWSQKGLAERAKPCSYNGTKAKAEFKAPTGCSSNIPLENNSVPFLDDPVFDYEYFDCLFWDQKCLKNEVLTHSLGRKKVSRITLGSLEDLGYKVNYTTADPYGPNDIGVCAGCNSNRRLGDDANTPMPLCHQGGAFERAVRKGKEMLGTLHTHHTSQPESSNMPKGIIYMGNQHLTVAYRHEDGTMCSVIVTSSGHVL